MSGRYKAVPEKIKGSLCYVVEDTLTGEWKHVYDCFLWAEKKAKEMNRKDKNSNQHSRTNDAVLNASQRTNNERDTDDHKTD